MRGLTNIATLAIAVCAMCNNHLSAQYAFAGIYSQQTTENKVVEAASWEDLLAQQKLLSAQGYYFSDLEFRGESDQKSYWSIISKGNIKQDVHRETAWKEMVVYHQSAEKEGWMLSDIEAEMGKDGTSQFVGVWKKGEAKQQLWKLNSWGGVRKLTDEMADKRMYLQDLEIMQDPEGDLSFVLLFELGVSDQRTHLVVHHDIRTYLEDRMARNKSGYRITDFESWANDQKSVLVSIFVKGDGKESLRNNLNPSELETVSGQMAESGLQLTDLEVLTRIQPVAKPLVQKASAHNYSASKE